MPDVEQPHGEEWFNDQEPPGQDVRPVSTVANGRRSGRVIDV